MAKYQVTLTVEVNEVNTPDWILQSIEEQLEDGESLFDCEIKLVENN